MINNSRALSKTFSRRLAILLVTPVMVLGMLVTPFGVFAPQKASAADPHGDWYQQYATTQSYAWQNCYHFQPTNGSCSNVVYITSGVSGTSSRQFVWNIYWAFYICTLKVSIYNNNYIYNADFTYCVYR